MNAQALLFDALCQMRTGEPESASAALAAAIRDEFKRRTRLSDAESRSAARRVLAELALLKGSDTDVDPEWRPILQAIRILLDVCAPTLPANLCGSSGIAALELAYEASCG